MHQYDHTWLKASVAQRMQQHAAASVWAGRNLTAYFHNCQGTHRPTGTVLIFTRDVGYHTSGWWKNPDYERCFHLSLSFRDPETGEPAPRDKKLTKEWIDLFFGISRRLLWCEPPYSPAGRQSDTWHYRLFCDQGWQPIKPRGEVYGRELTEAGWKSYSDVQADLEAAAAAVLERT